MKTPSEGGNYKKRSLQFKIKVIEKVNAQQGQGGNNQLESITNILSAHTDALQVS